MTGSNKEAPTIVWFRRDLRIADNPALVAAAERRRPVLPLFILDMRDRPGKASDWWLHGSLSCLSDAFRKRGAELVLRKGRPEEIIPALARETGADAVFWNRCYEPHAVERDSRLKSSLSEAGVEAKSFAASLLAEPWEVKTKAGEPYKVFTPFWKALAAMAPFGAPLVPPRKLQGACGPVSDSLEDWKLRPSSPDWAVGFVERWTPGEKGAHEFLHRFLENCADTYGDRRDFPAEESTSRLSPSLHWGEISPRQIWAAVEAHRGGNPAAGRSLDKYLSEIAWRDFAYHLIYHWPSIPQENWKEGFDRLPWADDDDAFRRWAAGKTGYPIVDAGMRELWQTGWMHNRVRMIAASFLVKDLLIHWRRGAEWFEDTLVDADLAVNRASWQWVAGSGADAAPYFRIFNPVLQGEKFDPEGDYIRRYVPELAELEAKYIHKPWEAPARILAEAGVMLGETYPYPIVDHGVARERALKAYEVVKKAS